MAQMRLDDVLMRLDEDSDNDFDGYLEDDELRDTDGGDGGDDSGSGDSTGSDSEDHGNSSNSDDINGHMSVDGGNSDSDGSERRYQQRVEGSRVVIVDVVVDVVTGEQVEELWTVGGVTQGLMLSLLFRPSLEVLAAHRI